MEHASAIKDSLGVGVKGSPWLNDYIMLFTLILIVNHSNQNIFVNFFNHVIGAQKNILAFRVAQDAFAIKRDPCRGIATESMDR